MEDCPPRAGILVRLTCRCLLLCLLTAIAAGPLPAQSTFGSILGIVRDSTGAVVQGVQVTLTNTGTTAHQSALTDGGGNYAFKNVEVGAYKLTFAATGFETDSLPAIELTAR